MLPDPYQYLRNLDAFISEIREQAGIPAPLHSYGLIGARIYYGTLENA